jgi:hypothetical protein
VPGLKVLTDLDSHKALRSAWRAAQEQGYSLASPGLDEPRFEARKGHVVWSMLVGPLAPYLHFKVSVEKYDNGCEVVLDKTLPWITTGAVGVGRVNRQAEELMDAIAAALEKDGGRVLERKTF